MMLSPDGVAQVDGVVPCAWSCYRRGRRMALHVVRLPSCRALLVAALLSKVQQRRIGAFASFWSADQGYTSTTEIAVQAHQSTLCERFPFESPAGVAMRPHAVWIPAALGRRLASRRPGPRFSPETRCAGRHVPGEVRSVMARPQLFAAGSAKGTGCGVIRLILSAQNQRHIANLRSQAIVQPEFKHDSKRKRRPGSIAIEPGRPPRTAPEKPLRTWTFPTMARSLQAGNAPAGRIGEVRAGS
ncbi:hypothetical protein [Cupriavidus sp. MP-37]|uniref:hypothetical protein n=1 Tax=Cupriavidus sp. MP-37 TaxID=2884455 RepID=UPI001D0A46E2|nr:hypothetical protein [Cupriavidus sp. MP-37]UDM49754.1 hypothetical protein LIN44_14190 [Cupriavidus sp. MP-37]